MAEEQEQKRPVAHKRAIEMLEESPVLSLPTLLELYAPGTVVPAKDIPALCVAFDNALGEMFVMVRRVTKALQEQRVEAEAKEKEKKEVTA